MSPNFSTSASAVSPDRRERDRLLKGMLGAAAAAGCLVLALMLGGGVRPLEATVQMERLADKVEQVKVLPRETTQQIARLLGEPWYDCSRTACSAPVQARNSAARNRLQTLVAERTPGSGLAAADGSKSVLVRTGAIGQLRTQQ